MALPPQALEQLAREAPRTPGWSGKLLMFSSTLFIVALFSWVGLSFGYEPFLMKQSDELDTQLAASSKQIDSDTQAELISFYSQLANLDKIVDNHVYSSGVFDMLEARVHPNVYFNKLDLNTETGKAVLGGAAKAVKDVTEQVKLLEGDERVASVLLGNVSAQSGGLWQFDLTLNFKPGTLTEIPGIPSTATATDPPALLTGASSTPPAASSTASTTFPR